MKMIMKKQITLLRHKLDQDIHIETYIQNKTCLGKMMPLCEKQYLSNILRLSSLKS